MTGRGRSVIVGRRVGDGRVVLDGRGFWFVVVDNHVSVHACSWRVRVKGIESASNQPGSRSARRENARNGLARYSNNVRSPVVTNSSAGMPARSRIGGLRSVNA